MMRHPCRPKMRKRERASALIILACLAGLTLPRWLGQSERPAEVRVEACAAVVVGNVPAATSFAVARAACLRQNPGN
ncbi:hypothetical protein SAMN05444149_10872 [Pseudosulfitobacter pseudonitzschiae]|uniref:Uncharacterized protein n=1 Tax=Pseudosulfitobacter pseudonitzschiae TaxID=1402135 RepID=A0A073IUE8_9RHOB|nr:hypothetical protein SUH3_11845 [Pseudosulfitobacter pseudonitzschiae]SHG00810.1 hypothetical protein SAMN05444149_10872 [Pseudosulfitobacter pseudonitzschiae]